jgi:hypothetical protein
MAVALSKCVLLSCILAFSGSCATIVARGPDRVPIESTPPGASVFLDGRPLGITPLKASIDRDDAGVLRLELAGHEAQTMNVERVFNGWFVGNVVFGGLIGMAIDLIAGNVTKWSTDKVHVQLQPAKA